MPDVKWRLCALTSTIEPFLTSAGFEDGLEGITFCLNEGLRIILHYERSIVLRKFNAPLESLKEFLCLATMHREWKSNALNWQKNWQKKNLSLFLSKILF